MMNNAKIMTSPVLRQAIAAGLLSASIEVKDLNVCFLYN